MPFTGSDNAPTALIQPVIGGGTSDDRTGYHRPGRDPFQVGIDNIVPEKGKPPKKQSLVIAEVLYVVQC